MRVVLLRLWVAWRSGWPAMLGLALLIALAGGASLGALAGARRTATANERMLHATDAADLFVNPDAGNASALTLDALASLPHVEQAARGEGVAWLPPGRIDSIRQIDTFPVGVAGDGAWGYTFGRKNLTAGRLADPDQPYEVVADVTFAREQGLHVGDHVRVRAVTGDENERLWNVSDEAEARALFDDPTFGEEVDLDVVGIGVAPSELIVEGGFKPLALSVTPAYMAHYGAPSVGWWGAALRLDQGAADVADVQTAAQALVPDEPVAFQTQAATTAKVDRTTRPYVLALLGFGAVSAVFGLIVVVQAVSRRARLDALDQRLLLSLGLGHASRFWSTIAMFVPAVALGAVGAALVGWSVTPLAPLGPVRDAEPTPGFRFDAPVLVLGAVGLASVVLALAAWPVWRATRAGSTAAARRAPHVARALAMSSGAPARTIGMRFALDTRGSDIRTPARAVLIGAGSAVLLAVALLSFGASLRHFVETPRLFGTDWNAVVTDSGDGGDADETQAQVTDALAAAPDVQAFSVVSVSELSIAGTRVPTLGLHPSPRPIEPTVLAGRAPQSPGDLALGRATAAELGLHVGDPVTITDASGTDQLFRLSGIVVLPETGTYQGSDKTSLGAGALLGQVDFERVAESFDKRFAVVKVNGSDPVTTVRAVLPTPDDGTWLDVAAPPVPAEVSTLANLRSTPSLLLGMLVVLLAAAVAHTLLLAFRAHRHDIAVLQALGFRPRQVVATSLWQATTTAVVALGVGAPLGLIAGRWLWRLVVQQLGVVSDPVTPLLALLATGVAVIGLVNALGVLPGWRASRATPATLLRSE